MKSVLLGALVLSIIKGIALLISYISNNAFPQPLTEEEEANCLRLMQTGDEIARFILIEHNLRLVAHIIKNLRTGEDNDDLISIGTIGLIKAINTFDQIKNQLHLRARCIENEIRIYEP